MFWTSQIDVASCKVVNVKGPAITHEPGMYRAPRARHNTTIEKRRRDLFRPRDSRRPEDICYTVDIPKRLIAVIGAKTASWSRVAHEHGHYLIEDASMLSEDIYSSDLPPGSDFTADGGVLVTRVIRDTQNNSQGMRVNTLLQSQSAVFPAGDITTNSASTIKISVVSSTFRPWPLIFCSTSTYTTPDIWVTISGGDATDPPVVGERNTIHARICHAGAVAAADVRATVYAIEPSGVGDNGSRTLLGVRTSLASPPVGRPRCKRTGSRAQ
ncbi:hypothetical protein MMYC01_205982 [Madurella mycetomatis]|uniref:Uncharacterized protein n=1 Tax=Madurella mycetomatis TaxID=100816 RepID=A0A175W264_9PEZI|nr:hypothetical protein MMYC01_205982 [Madurella mycetomatis]